METNKVHYFGDEVIVSSEKLRQKYVSGPQQLAEADYAVKYNMPLRHMFKLNNGPVGVN